MKQHLLFTFVLWSILLSGVAALYSYQGMSTFLNHPPKLLGNYCTELAGLTFRLEAHQKGEKSFFIQGAAATMSAQVKQKIVQHHLYLQAPKLNYVENFDNYYSKVRPLSYQKNGLVKVFRYDDMIYDRRDCGEFDG